MFTFMYILYIVVFRINLFMQSVSITICVILLIKKKNLCNLCTHFFNFMHHTEIVLELIPDSFKVPKFFIHRGSSCQASLMSLFLDLFR